MRVNLRTILVVGSTLLMLVAFGLASCSGNSSTTSSQPTTATGTASGVAFSKDIQPIFNANCVSCHQGPGSGGLNLEAAGAYNNLVNVKSTEATSLMRVAPGAPDKSYLINKLEGTQTQVGGSGARMPFGASPLPGETIDKIKQWISAGAENN